MVMAQLIQAQVRRLKESVSENTDDIERVEILSENAMTTWTFREYTLAEAPLDSDPDTTMNGFAMAIISDGRKPGEGAGSGTGVVAMYDPTQDDWLRSSDYTSVVT